MAQQEAEDKRYILGSQPVMRLRILLSLLEGDPATCSVSAISRSLEIEKYQVSRILTQLEKEGLADRTDNRHPRLTAGGMKEAGKYQERVDACTRFLLSKGVDADSAAKDAVNWALVNSDAAMRMIRYEDAWERAKEELSELQSYTGEELCSHLMDGSYRIPFVITRETVKNGESLSMANRGFLHPCVLTVHDGKGSIKLTARTMRASSGATSERLAGKVKSLKYLYDGYYVEAQRTGDILEIPASALRCTAVGEDGSTVIHGTMLLKMTASVGLLHMPEGRAIFMMIL